ncbi:MAG: energy transducer TonB [Gemmatimonadota bacterium]
MFETLVESRPRKQRTFGQTVVSLIVHGALIFGAVKVTQGAAEQVKEILQDTTLVFLKPPDAPPPPPEQPPPDVVVSANPPPKGFQTVVAPTDIPKDIPPVNLNERFDPKDFSGKGVEGGVATGIVGGTGPVTETVTGQTFLQDEVDDRPEVVSVPQPRYPPLLEQAGIGGQVIAQFIVDTTGHVEPGSFKVIKTPHPAFEAPVREAIMKAVFKPGRMRGTAVRVLVQQPVTFRGRQ